MSAVRLRAGRKPKVRAPATRTTKPRAQSKANAKRKVSSAETKATAVTDALYGSALKATRGGALFNAFPYPTKISPESIGLFIAMHTKPGDTVLDVFAGSGTTGIGAMLCERPTDEMKSEAARFGLKPVWGPRNAVLYELSALGAFVGKTLTHPPEPNQFRKAAEQLLADAQSELDELYAARSPDGETGIIRYVIWSDVLRCPCCRKTSTLWDGCVEREPASINGHFTCRHCKRVVPLDDTTRVTEKQNDPVLGGKRALRRREAVWIYGSSGRKNWSRAATKDDVATAAKALGKSVPASVPNVAIPWGDLYRSGYHSGITHLHHFYTMRNLVVFGRLWDRTLTYERKIGDALRFWLLSYNASHATIMTRVVAKAGQDDLVVTSGQPGVLYVSGLPVEKNLFSGLRRKLQTIAEAFAITHGLEGKVQVEQASSASLDLRDASIDYVFTDPPFGGNIPYAEVNFINEAWLGCFTDRTGEAIVSPAQGKSVLDYQRLLTASLSEARRVLKDGGQATLVFHSATAAIWNALRGAYSEAGFGVRHAGVLDKTQGSFKQVTTTGAVKGDPLLLLEKAHHVSGPGSADVWSVADELLRVASHARDPNERTPERLYSRLIAYFLKQNQTVPLDAEAFYRWHADRCRSGVAA